MCVVAVPNLNPPNTHLHQQPTHHTSNTPDLSSLLNLPQFQGLVSLAQTNPALFNQLTNSTYFDVPEVKQESCIKNEQHLLNMPPPSNAQDLETSLKSLANELGFESDQGLDYVNMDDFLSTYSKFFFKKKRKKEKEN